MNNNCVFWAKRLKNRFSIEIAAKMVYNCVEKACEVLLTYEVFYDTNDSERRYAAV